MIRRFIAIVAVCGALSGLALADWPIFRGNPLQSGVAAEKLPAKLEVLWKYKTGDAIEGTAAIADGVVYVGSFDSHLHAIDLATGKQKWKYKAGPFKAHAGYHKGSVYIGDLDGIFHCVDAATGKKKWTFETEGEIQSGANFSGEHVLFGSGDEHIYCLSKAGKLVWKFQVPGGPVMGTPAVTKDRTFAAGCDSELHVLDLKTGKDLAAVDLGGQVGATVAVADDRLYVGTMNSEVLAVDWNKKVPAVAWKFEPERNFAFYASAAVSKNLIVVGGRDKRITALDRLKGKPVWSFPTEARVDCSPVIVGNRVFAGSFDKNLYELDLAKGTQIKKYELGSAVIASPAVGGGCLVVGTEDGVVYCLGAKK